MQASDTERFILSLTEKEELRQKIRSLLENRKEILFAYLHGSFRVGKQFKDIDLALYVDVREISALDYELGFEVLLQDTFNYPFDVRLLNNCPTSFAYQVIRGGERIYVADDDRRATFEEGVLARYLDFLPYHKQYLSDGYGITV
jgi:predicted nucleotidyltransferase